MYSVTAASKRLACSSALAIGACGGSAAFRFSSRARNACARAELALHQRHHVPPGVRHELDVLQVPVVILERRCRRVRSSTNRLRVEPRRERVGRLLCPCDVCRQDRRRASRRAMPAARGRRSAAGCCRCRTSQRSLPVPTRFFFACSSSPGIARTPAAIRSRVRRRTAETCSSRSRPRRRA